MEIKFPESRHPFCSKKNSENPSKNEKINSCEKFREKKEIGFSICPYGFTCYKNNDVIFCGYKVSEYVDEKKICGHEKHSTGKFDMTIFTPNDFLKYIEFNDKHNVYRSTIHDIKRAISSIRDAINEIDLDDETKSIRDGYDLISTRLDYHDKILLKNDATKLFSKIKPHKMIKKLKILLDYKASTKNIKFEFEGSPNIEIYQDSKAIFILFFILMENAVKYAPTNTTITIKFDDLTKYSTSILIKNRYEDLKREDLNNIFKRGFRGNNNSNSSGDGLGLAVAKEIMDEYHLKYNVSLDENYYYFYLEIPSLDKDGNIYNSPVNVYIQNMLKNNY